MARKVLLYMILPAVAAFGCWRLWPRHPLLAAVAAGFAVATVCQLAIVVLHLRPVEAGGRTNLLVGIGYYLPWAAAIVTGAVIRSGVKGVLAALLGTALGLGVATVVLDALRLIRLRFFA